MEKLITITSKGQTTLPAAIRHKFGLGKAGGVLQITYNEQKEQLIISRPTSITELSQRISGYVKPGIDPITDVDAYYQAHRKPKV